MPDNHLVLTHLAGLKLELGADYQSRVEQYRGLGAVAGMGIKPLRVALPIAADVSRRGGDTRLFLAVAKYLTMAFELRQSLQQPPGVVATGWRVSFRVCPAPTGFIASVALAANEFPNEPLSCEFHFP